MKSLILLLLLPIARADAIVDVNFNPLFIPFSLLLTIVIELIIFSLLTKHSVKNSLIFVSVLNLFTWAPAAWLYHYLVNNFFAEFWMIVFYFTIIELIVILIESVFLYSFELAFSRRDSFTISSLMNITSALIGFFLSVIIIE